MKKKIRYIPARKIRDNYSKNIGYIASNKPERMIQRESLFERDVVYFLEYSEEIKEIYEQPVAIPYFFQGKYRHYYPDYKCTYTDGHIEIIEVKPAAFLDYPEIRAKINALAQYCHIHGFTPRIIKEEDIYVGERAANIKMLSYYRKKPGKIDEIIPKVLDVVREYTNITINQIANLLKEEKYRIVDAVFYLLYRHILITDLTLLISHEKSMLSLAAKIGEK